MNENNKRVMWLDVLKGLAIMAVVVHHHPWFPHKLFIMIASFAVPLFFFISGYLFNPDSSFQDYILKRFKSLLKPYLFSVTIVCIAYIIVKGTPSFLWYSFWTIYGNGPNLPKIMLHLWFLPNLFLVTLFVWVLYRYFEFLKSSISGQLLLIIVFFILGSFGINLFWNIKVPISVTNFFITDGNLFFINGLLENPEYSKEALLMDKQFILKGLPWSLDVVFITSAFFMSGYFVKQNRLENMFHKDSIALIMLLVFTVFHYGFDYSLNLNIRRYDSLFICTIEAFAAIYILIYSSYWIAKVDNNISSFFKYLGRYTLVIFIFHSVVQSKIYFTIVSLLPDSAHSIAILTAFAAGMFIPLLLNWLLFERFNFFRYWYYAK